MKTEIIFRLGWIVYRFGCTKYPSTAIVHSLSSVFFPKINCGYNRIFAQFIRFFFPSSDVVRFFKRKKLSKNRKNFKNKKKVFNPKFIF